MYNLQNQQGIMNQNVALRNQQQQYNKQLEQQKFNNELAKLSGMSGAGGALSNNYANQSNQTRQNWSNIGSGVGQGMMGYQMHQNQLTSQKPMAQAPMMQQAPAAGPQLDTFDYDSFMKKLNASNRNTGNMA